MEHKYEEVAHFEKYVDQTSDLLVDSHKWKVMAKHCSNPEMKSKYMEISSILYDMFMNEYNSIMEKYREV